ncbi:uncharacterized protein LOC134281802 isoform X2 [Saccostrea cucullata]|uniref:uncharacterized protein LOC134281802 isoform X2 n=1 Tax=Saccostrea cuccullata TaxID=36930 RepID=UPI002ED41537
MMVTRRRPILVSYVVVLFTVSSENVKCVLSNQLNEIECLGKIITQYKGLYSCPWDITTTCRGASCYELESECGVQDPGVTNVSITVYMSMIPFLEDHKVIQAKYCPCKNHAFVCNLTSNILVDPENTQCLSTTVENINSVTTESPATNTRKEYTTVCPDTNVIVESTCSKESGVTLGAVVGATFGGVLFTLVVIGFSIFLFKKIRNSKNPEKVRNIRNEMATQNPAYGSQSDMTPLEQNQLRTNTMNSTEYYSSISENSIKFPQKVSHVRPIVRYENEPLSQQIKSDVEIYDHLNESKRRNDNDNYDLATPVTVTKPPSSSDYDVLKCSKSDNEYTEVIGDGFQQ